MRDVLLAGCWLVLTVLGPVHAQAVEPAKSLQAYLAQPKVVGQGTYRVWGLDIYQATLWHNESGFQADQWPTQRFALELRYARDFDGPDIAKRSIEEMHKQSPLLPDKARLWLKTLEAWMPNVKKNQTLTGIHVPGEATVFLHNHVPIGSIGDAELSRRFFAIWLSPQTSAPQLRKSLLGQEGK